jgi:hypothetical protein
MTVKLSINNISYYNISEVLSLLQKYKQKMITYNGDNYANKFYNMIYLVNKVNIKKNKVKSNVQVRRQTVFNDLLPDNDGVDDFLQSLDIPAQETCSNVPISKSMCQFHMVF